MTYSAPSLGRLPPVFLSTMSIASMGGQDILATDAASGAVGAANRITYVPFTLSHDVTVFRYFWLNGATASTDNVQIGVYRDDFTQVNEGTSTTAAGANVCQFDNVTDYTIAAGRYYMALWVSGVTTTFFRWSGSLASLMTGVYYESNAGGLPATGTPADPAVATGTLVPIFGLALRATDP